jgi:RND family efflux transporter MFP subunit
LCLGTGIARAEGIEAITKPSEDVTLSFVLAGRIAKVLVKEGDEVKENQLLVQQDDAAERTKLDQLKADAEETVRIRAQEAQLAQKTVDLHKLEEAFEKKAVSKWDVEHARLEVAMAELSLELAKFQHTQNQLKYEETKIQVERMRLESPIPGKVEKVSVKVGESADALAQVIRVVKIDPLWVEVPVPLADARKLKVARPAQVRFADNPGQLAAGRVIHIGAVADAASDTLTVRVELPNPTGRPAGEHVGVSFPAPE